MSFKPWILLLIALLGAHGPARVLAQSPDVEVALSGTTGSYSPGGQTTLTLNLRNRSTVAGVNNAQFSMALVSVPQIASVSWAVTGTANGAAVDTVPPNGTGDFNLQADFAAATSISVAGSSRVLVRLEIRWRANASGTPTLTLTHTNPVAGDPTGNNSVSITPGAGGGVYTQCTDAGSGSPAVGVNTVVNTYFPAPTDGTLRTLTAGSRCLPISVDNVLGANPGAVSRLDDIEQGDLLMIIQMQGAEIDSTDTDAYGDGAPGGGSTVGGLTNLRQTGRYELVTAEGAINTAGAGVTPACDVLADPGTATAAVPLTVPISGQGSAQGLLYSYERQKTGTVKNIYQIVRVPRYASVTLAGSNSIVAAPWNGLVGGIVAMDVLGTIDLGSGAGTRSIHADARGFRGGMGRTLEGLNGSNADAFRSAFAPAPADAHGLKGEGIAGTPELVFDGSGLSTSNVNSYPNGSNARGAPGNAGGGGNACLPSADDGHLNVAGGGGGSNAGQGGNGGACGGGVTTQNGGRRPPPVFNTSVRERIFMGGGGGAGARNTGTGNESSGGVGGGIVLLRASRFIGTGRISADGSAGQAGSTLANEGGGGGGGAGGTVILQGDFGANSNFTNLDLFMRGGAGGNSASAAPDLASNRTGPGGGGGGGVLLTSLLGDQLATVGTGNGVQGTTTVNTSATHEANPGDVGTNQNSLVPYDLVPGAKPAWMCTNSVPVTLSYVDARVEGEQLRVAFETASEAGTLGFRVSQGAPAGARNSLTSELILGRGDALGPGRYEVVMRYGGATELWIEEQDVRGNPTVFGPFPIGSPSGERNIAVSTDWRAIHAEQDAFRVSEARAVLARRSATDAVVELRTSQRGWYSVSFEQVAALGVNWSGIETRRLELRRGTLAIPLEVDGAVWQTGATLRFYGEQIDGNLYTDTAVYRLGLIAGEAVAPRPLYAAAGALPAASTYLHTLNHAPNRGYGFSSPVDPWFALRLQRSANSPGSGSETVIVADRVPGSAARMVVDFWGGTDFPQAPDHAVSVVVNGTPVGVARFDGFESHRLTVDLPASLLVDGNNTVGFQLLADTGVAADVVYLERIAIEYVRELKLEANGSVVFNPAQAAAGAADVDRIFSAGFGSETAPACSSTSPGCAAYSVWVGANPNARAFRVRHGSAQPLSAAVEGGVLRFAAVAQPGDSFRVDTNAAAPDMRVAEPVGDLFGGQNAVDYLVISHPSFSAGLQPLLAARQAEGLRTHVVNIEALYRAYASGEFGPAAVEAFLRESHQRWPMLRYVVFVGGDTYDYKNFSGLNSIGFVPTHYRRTSEFVHYAPSDAVYGDVNGDGLKELAIGRLPVRSAAELSNLIAKTLAYPSAGHANRVHWVSDRDDSRYSFARLSGVMLPTFVNWTSTSTDLAAFPQSGGAAQARADIVAALSGGRALLGYYGHSSPSSWTREGLLTATQVNGGLFTNANRPSALFQLGCWGGYFVEPTYSSLSHALLLQPNGVAAVIAATGVTEVRSDELFAAESLPALSTGQRIGDVVRDSANRIRSADPTALDVILGTAVLGDPALRINVQAPR